MTFDDVWLVGVKYRIKTFELTIGSAYKYTVSNKLIVSMALVEDYGSYCFPYFEITFAVPNETYRLMQKYADNIKATFNLQKAKFKDAVSVKVDTAQAYKNSINNSFYVIFNDVTPELSETEQKVVESSGNDYGNLTVVQTLLYPYDYYTSYDVVVNTSLKNVTLADAATFCLNKCGMKNVLMSPPNNCKKYSQFIITPISLKDQLERICNSYAMHTDGTIIFFGLNRLYIIDDTSKCTAYQTNEYTITYVVADGKVLSSTQTGGCYEHSSKKYNLINATSLNIGDAKELSLKTVGSNIVSVNNDGTVVKSNGSATKVTNVLVQNEGGNTLQAMTVNDNEYVITAMFSNVDIDMLTPNKQFILTVDGSSNKSAYNGKYCLSKVAHSFSKDGDTFSVSSTAEFSSHIKKRRSV